MVGVEAQRDKCSYVVTPIVNGVTVAMDFDVCRSYNRLQRRI